LFGSIATFLTMPASNATHIAVSVQPLPEQATVDANVVVICRSSLSYENPMPRSQRRAVSFVAARGKHSPSASNAK
jgi:hypothetical protein